VRLVQYAVLMDSCIMMYRINFMKIDAGAETILRFCLRNLRNCNVGITDSLIYDIHR
jgi:hypothetical protein